MTIPISSGNLASALHACAAGIHPAEAGTSLLTGSGCWLHREDFTGRFIITGTSSDGTAMASIDWEDAISALDAGELPCSSGERSVLLLAGSIAAGTQVRLNDELPGIDDRNAALVIQAVAHAAGQTWLTSASMTDLAELIVLLDEFLRSSEEVTALLTAFLAARGEQHPGYHASLLIDWASFTAARHRRIVALLTPPPSKPGQ
jgi:hypothetical protein